MSVSTMIKSESKVPVKMKSESAGIDNNQYNNISSAQYKYNGELWELRDRWTQCMQKSLDKYNK